jgi:hypothetical protein
MRYDNSQFANRRADFLHWLLFALAIFGAFMMGPPKVFAQSNQVSTQTSLHEAEASQSAEGDQQSETSDDLPGEIEGEPVDASPEVQVAEPLPPSADEEERDWSDDDERCSTYAARLVGTWRIDLTQFMTRHISERGRPGLAIIAGSVSRELFGESYGVVTAHPDGSGAAEGYWLGERIEDEGDWEVVAVDGDYAKVRLIVPSYGIDRTFEVRHEDDRVHAHYNGLPAIFVRQTTEGQSGE